MTTRRKFLSAAAAAPVAASTLAAPANATAMAKLAALRSRDLSDVGIVLLPVLSRASGPGIAGKPARAPLSKMPEPWRPGIASPGRL